MGWNYRVLAHKQFDEVYFYIHEVYYDEEGNPINVSNPDFISFDAFVYSTKEVVVGTREVFEADGESTQEDILGTELVYNFEPTQYTDEDLVEYLKTRYAECRQAEYPPMADYIDAIVKGDEVQKQVYIDACKEVKLKYPKPEEHKE